MAQRTWALASFNEKYRCPEEGVLKLDSSPSTRTVRKCSASNWLVSRLSWVTVMILRRKEAIFIASRELEMNLHCNKLNAVHSFFVYFLVAVD